MHDHIVHQDQNLHHLTSFMQVNAMRRWRLPSRSMSNGQYFSCRCSMGCLRKSSCKCTARLSRFDEAYQVMPYFASEQVERVFSVKSVKCVISMQACHTTPNVEIMVSMSSISRSVKQVMQSCSHRQLVQSMRGDGMVQV
jgi:hypothetical protein